MRILDLAGLKFGVIRIGSLGPHRFGEHHKPAGMCFGELANCFAQRHSITAREFDHGTNVLAVHHGQTLGGIHIEWDLPRDAAAGLGDVGMEVGMEVDYRETGTRDLGLGNMQHAFRFILLERNAFAGRRLPIEAGLPGGLPVLSPGAASRERHRAEGHPFPAVHCFLPVCVF